MAVALKQILELVDIIQKYIPLQGIVNLTVELEQTEAARKNQSFRGTVIRLRSAAMQKKASMSAPKVKDTFDDGKRSWGRDG